MLRAIDEQEVAEEIAKNEEWAVTSAELRAWLATYSGSDQEETLKKRFGGVEHHPHVLFLGTGAALPSKYRNVTSVYVSVPSSGGILLDAGEGSFGQLARRFGIDAAYKVRGIPLKVAEQYGPYSANVCRSYKSSSWC